MTDTDIDDEKFDEELLNPPAEPEPEPVEEPEVIETLPVTTEQPPLKKGFLSLKKKTIAELAERGYSCAYIASQVHMTANRVYRLVNHDTAIWNEIERIRSEKFKKIDEKMIDLLLKSLESLEEDLLNPTKRAEARNRILDLVKELKRGVGKPADGGAAPTIQQQFFGQTPQGQGGATVHQSSIDDIIIKKSKERGLAIPKVEKKKIIRKEENEGEQNL